MGDGRSAAVLFRQDLAGVVVGGRPGEARPRHDAAGQVARRIVAERGQSVIAFGQGFNPVQAVTGEGRGLPCGQAIVNDGGLSFG